MTRYEFRVIPAPTRGEKSREAKTTPERFARALTRLMNEMGQEGWDYVRADTLPVEERSGFTGTKTSFQNMLVFRRVLASAAEAAPPAITPPASPQAEPAPRLGAAEAPTGTAPPLGPATAGLAAAE